MALIQCKECGKPMSSGAKACPHCGKRRTSKTTMGCLWIIILVVGVMAFTYHSVGNDAPTGTATAVPAPASSVIASAPAHSVWSYGTSSDSMTGKTVKTATLESTNTETFKFPYGGEQHAALMIRQHPRYGRDVLFSIERGQFGCAVDGCAILVRFDDRKAERFTGQAPGDNSSTNVFITPSDRFYARLQKSKTVRIESTFYQEGVRVFTFDIADFDAGMFGKGG